MATKRCPSLSPIVKFDCVAVQCQDDEGHSGPHHGVSYDQRDRYGNPEPRCWDDSGRFGEAARRNAELGTLIAEAARADLDDDAGPRPGDNTVLGV